MRCVADPEDVDRRHHGPVRRPADARPRARVLPRRFHAAPHILADQLHRYKRCTVTGRQDHAETRFDLNESAFGLIADVGTSFRRRRD